MNLLIGVHPYQGATLFKPIKKVKNKKKIKEKEKKNKSTRYLNQQINKNTLIVSSPVAPSPQRSQHTV